MKGTESVTLATDLNIKGPGNESCGPGPGTVTRVTAGPGTVARRRRRGNGARHCHWVPAWGPWPDAARSATARAGEAVASPAPSASPGPAGIRVFISSIRLLLRIRRGHLSLRVSVVTPWSTRN